MASSSETRISPYSLPDLKNTTDDALGNYLRGLDFRQDNTKLDFRLIVGYIAVVIAAATFVADYKLGWEATKVWTALAVGLYTAFNGIFTFWMWFVEAGLVFEGTKGRQKISISSKTNKNEPTYYLTITTSSPASGSPSTWQIKAPFTTWFTSDGYFVAKPFQQWLATSVDVVGEADQKNAVKAEQKMVDAEVDGAPTASGADVGGNGKGSKRSKRKG